MLMSLPLFLLPLFLPASWPCSSPSTARFPSQTCLLFCHHDSSQLYHEECKRRWWGLDRAWRNSPWSLAFEGQECLRSNGHWLEWEHPGRGELALSGMPVVFRDEDLQVFIFIIPSLQSNNCESPAGAKGRTEAGFLRLFLQLVSCFDQFKSIS